MTTATRSTVVGVFPDRRLAARAFTDLRHAGFQDRQLGVVARDTEVKESITGESDSTTGTAAAVGAAAGGGVGGLWGLAVAAGLLPAIGPVVAGGTLAAVLASTAAGLAAGGVFGALVGLGLSEEEARHYEQEVQAGRILITVDAGDRAEEAATILAEAGGLTKPAAPNAG